MSVFKNIPSKNYLILSSAYLGSDPQILKIFNQVVNLYKADVIHIGPVSDPSMYKKADKSFDSATRSYIDATTNIERLSKEFKKIEFLMPENEPYAVLNNMSIDDIADKWGLHDQYDEYQDDDIDVFYPNHAKPSNVTYTVDYMKQLSQYLGLSSVMPKSAKATRGEAQNRVKEEFYNYADNWIFPHPTPQIGNVGKMDFNESLNQLYVGCLKFFERNEKMNNFYKTDFLPCAVFVSVDTIDGTFHARQIFIEKDGNSMFALDDGMVFFNNKTITVGSVDKGMYSTDHHSPIFHRGAMAANNACTELHEPEELIDGGDSADSEGSNRHNLKDNNRRAMEGKRVIHDIKARRYLYNLLGSFKSIKRRISIDSNHLNWNDKYVDQRPELEGIIDLKSQWKLFFKDWLFILSETGKMNYYYWGDILIRHGHQESLMKGAQISKVGKILQGHRHYLKSFKRAMQMHCLSSFDHGYFDNTSSAMQNGFAALTKYKDIAAASPKIVIHDNNKKTSKFSYRDKIYEVAWLKDDNESHLDLEFTVEWKK